VAALETHYGTDFLGEQIDDLALAFIAPLGTKHYDRLTHDGLLELLRPWGRRTGKP